MKFLKFVATASLMFLMGSLAAMQRAEATLIFDGVQELRNTFLDNNSLNATNLVLRVQTPSTDPGPKQGCVGRSGGCPGGILNPSLRDPDRIVGGSLGGNELTTDHTKTIAGGTVGATSPGDLRVVLSPLELVQDPGLTLNDLRLTIYNADGTVQFSSGALPSAIDIPGTNLGSPGFFFRLDAVQAAAAGVIDATDRLGLSARVSNADFGDESFLITSVSTPPKVITPEPTTLLLFGTGLGSLAAARWRRKASC